MSDEELVARLRKYEDDLLSITADRIQAQAAEIERLRGEVARAEAILEREIMRVKKIQTDLPPPHKVSLFYVQSEYELMLAELKGDKP